MDITFYNTLTKTKERFVPIDESLVTMYSCGPTVYDFAHIGNFRSFLFADLIRRTLEFFDHTVHQVMNITDVGHMTDDTVIDGAGEDKMAVAAKRIKESKKAGTVPEGAVDNPDDPYEVADYYTTAFLQDARTLAMKVAFESPHNVLRATRHVDAMITMIKTLIARKHAYVGSDGVIYFSVDSFNALQSLSGNDLDKLRAGASGRVDEGDQSHKRHPADFMLWKPDRHHLMNWESPWGNGYPGWHIECSALAKEGLGREVIDIHTGGEDLIFPHHECELMQSCGASGQDVFANFWMHAHFLLVEGRKMSKRLGNFWTVRDVLDGKATGVRVHPAVLRLELIKSHYRGNMNFTSKGLHDSARIVKRLQKFRTTLEASSNGVAEDVDLTHPIVREFAQALADDLNMSGAIGAIMPWASTTPKDPAEALGALDRINQVLAVAPIVASNVNLLESSCETIDRMCRELDQARSDRDFATADALRDEIIARGYTVKTTQDGTTVEKKLA